MSSSIRHLKKYFHDKMHYIKAITKASNKDIEMLTDTVNHIITTTKFSTSQIIYGIEVFAKQGLTVDEINNRLKLHDRSE